MGHALEDLLEVCIRLDPIELRRGEKQGDEVPTLAAAVGSGERMVLTSQSHWPGCAFQRVGIELDVAVIEEPAERRPACEGIEAREVRHLSVFALALQPLLIELGRLLCDIVPADVYQLHREPKGWAWPEDGRAIEFRVREASRTEGPVALVFALSATVADERITEVLGSDAAIWSIEAKTPHNDIMKRPADLAEFRRIVRSVFNRIKAQHGERAVINVFPAMPVSTAVEVGRVWMPKADLPLVIYDQNRILGGFARVLSIGLEGAGCPRG